ncbi:MAG: hypothetical protein P8076_06350 [Gammaproteobacteria bacterium]
MKHLQNLLWPLALLLALVVLGTAGWKARGLLQPRATVTATTPNCDLQAGPCAARLADGRGVILTLSPRPVVALQPMRVHVRLVGLRVSRVVIDFTGVNMEMGFNRFVLKPDGAAYAGQAILPVCTRSRMEWRAAVLVQSADGVLAFPFRFATVRP